MSTTQKKYVLVRAPRRVLIRKGQTPQVQPTPVKTPNKQDVTEAAPPKK
jgi:hypothetical protein